MLSRRVFFCSCRQTLYYCFVTREIWWIRISSYNNPHIIIDAGNQSDIYRCVNFARQYGLDIKDTLRRIVVSRAFTIYQLVTLITKELPKVVRRFDTKVLIIRDMLHLFIESQIRIDEARPLLKEITNSLPRDMSVIVSLSRVPSQYKMLFHFFDRCIDVRSSDKPAIKRICRVAVDRGM